MSSDTAANTPRVPLQEYLCVGCTHQVRHTLVIVHAASAHKNAQADVTNRDVPVVGACTVKVITKCNRNPLALLQHWQQHSVGGRAMLCHSHSATGTYAAAALPEYVFQL